MPSTAETYRDAALEHLGRAQSLYGDDRQGNWFLIRYISGLAVECHLRAFMRRMTPEFEPRHNLEMLARASGFFNIVPISDIERFAERFATLNQRWQASQRYYAERQMLDYLNEVRAEFNKRGNRLENLSKFAFGNALYVINYGEAKWENWQAG